MPSICDKAVLLRKRLEIRSWNQNLSRVISIHRRYGWTSDRFGRTLLTFVRSMRSFGVVPTFPVTAVVLNRNPRLFRTVQEEGVELAVHGYRHIDNTALSNEEWERHLDQASDVFQRHGIRFVGHRFPYLRWNKTAIEKIKTHGFLWESSRSVFWDVLDPRRLSPKAWNAATALVKTYRSSPAVPGSSLPVLDGGLVHLPLSIPDDDMLVERLGIRSPNRLAEIWLTMMKRIVQWEECFVLQVHPERYWDFRQALENLIDSARQTGTIWIVPLETVAQWWKLRHTFRAGVTTLGKNRHRIAVDVPKGASWWIQSGNGKPCIRQNKSSGTSRDSRCREIECDRRPVIGVHPLSSQLVSGWLRDSGFAFEIGTDRRSYPVFMEPIKVFGKKEKEEWSQHLNRLPFPLVRFGRWPSGRTCVLSVTGDVDGVCISDFWSRFYGR